MIDTKSSSTTPPNQTHSKSSRANFNEAFLEPLLRMMRLRRVLPYIKSFERPCVLDIGCGWEARLLREIAPFIVQGVGIDFKAPHIMDGNITTFSYCFERIEQDKVEQAGSKQDIAMLKARLSMLDTTRCMDKAPHSVENTNSPISGGGNKL